MNHYVPMQDRTIDNALLALRKEIVRHGRDGLDHVEALLTLRGVELPEYTRRLPINGTYKGRMSRKVLGAIEGGHRTPEAITQALQAEGVSYQLMYQRVYQALLRLERKGKVRREGQWWRLAP